MKRKLLVLKYSISTLLVTAALCLLRLPFYGMNAGAPEPTSSPTVDIMTKLQPYQTPDAEPSHSDGRLLQKAPLLSGVEEHPVGTLDQQTFYAIADATVLEGYPTVNLGNTADMWAGYDEYLEPDGEIARSLVKFDIASLPPSQDITEATLRVRLVGSWDFPDTSRTIRTYRITSSWSESSVTWNNKPGYGGAYGSQSIVSGAWGWYEFDVTGLVSAWYDGTYTNHGIMLRGPEVSGYDSSWRAFGTRESDYTPELVIEYAPPSNTPPTISGLPDQTVAMNSSADNAIDLWDYADDVEDADADLTFTISNSPVAGVGVTIDSNRYIDINPDSGWAGATDVEIQVQDIGGLTDTDTFHVTVTGGTIYLPLVAKRWPPIPDTPVLNPISNPDGDGNYSVSWNAADRADTYTLQEDDNPAFSSPSTAYSGSGTSKSITGRDVGTYHYRVKASNEFGSSDWSNTEPVLVTVQPTGPKPGHYTGTPAVSFDVTEDQQVCNFRITVPFEDGTCRLRITTCMQIVDNQFAFVAEHPQLPQYENSITGRFDTRTHALGNYSVHFCEDTLVFTPSEGTWEASK